MTIGERIKFRRKELGMTQAELAEAVGYTSKSTIAKIESGVNDLVQSQILTLANALKTTPSYIMGWADSDEPENITIDVYDCVAAGIPNIFAEENVVDHEDISAEMSATGDYFGLKIKGDSMQPRICDGDTVIVRKQSTADDGQIVIALINGDYGVCKKLTRNKAGIGLISLNPIYEPLYFTKKEIETEPVTILGVVKELRAKF